MKVKLNTNFYIKGVSDLGYIELEDRATLRELLNEVSERCDGQWQFIRPRTNQVDPDQFLVIAGGSELGLLPRGLETELGDGDLVTISFWEGLLSGG